MGDNVAPSATRVTGSSAITLSVAPILTDVLGCPGSLGVSSHYLTKGHVAKYPPPPEHVTSISVILVTVATRTAGGRVLPTVILAVATVDKTSLFELCLTNLVVASSCAHHILISVGWRIGFRRANIRSGLCCTPFNPRGQSSHSRNPLNVVSSTLTRKGVQGSLRIVCFPLLDAPPTLAIPDTTN